MEITPSLAANLRLLTAAMFDSAASDTTDLADLVEVFVSNARCAVRSFLGLTITVIELDGRRAAQVVLRTTLLEDGVDAGDIRTSLRLSAPGRGAEPDHRGIELVLYAGTPGAFVDMDADLAFLTGHAFDPGDLDQHRNLQPDITGVLQAESVIHEAVGVLIARGHTREQAHTELASLAQSAHTDQITEATRILRNLTPRGPELSQR